MPDMITAGAILRLGPAAGIQYRIRQITIRVIGQRKEPCAPGSAWVDAYELGDDGEAVARRDIFIPCVDAAMKVPASWLPKSPPDETRVPARTRPATAKTPAPAR